MTISFRDPQSLQTNVFDRLLELLGGTSTWVVRAPFHPHDDIDLVLVPCAPDWHRDAHARAALAQLADDEIVARTTDDGRLVGLRLDDEVVEHRAAQLREGTPPYTSDLAHDEPVVVHYCDPNLTKALHVGHLRNIAIGASLTGAFRQAGADVQSRSVVADFGRSVAEALVGLQAHPDAGAVLDGAGDKPDHFVGRCYAEYVAALDPETWQTGEVDEGPVAREAFLHGDGADDLLVKLLHREPAATQLWERVRDAVLAGQRETLARLGADVDRTLFEADLIADARAVAAEGVARGLFTRTADGVTYETGRDSLPSLTLLRSDDVPTQHLRSLSYWIRLAAELHETRTIQICGDEWKPHTIAVAELLTRWFDGDLERVHPTVDLLHGMVAMQGEIVSSSIGTPLLIDELLDWVDAHAPARMSARLGLPEEEARRDAGAAAAGRIALGFFLSRPAGRLLGFQREALLNERVSAGWLLTLASVDARRQASPAAIDPREAACRFAIVQGEVYRPHLRHAIQRLDVSPLVRYVTHLARWWLQGGHGPGAAAVTHVLLDRGAETFGPSR